MGVITPSARLTQAETQSGSSDLKAWGPRTGSGGNGGSAFEKHPVCAPSPPGWFADHLP